ncbi:MAG: tyrosine-type recombinase/integrase [Actinomycetota bacterium]
MSAQATCPRPGDHCLITAYTDHLQALDLGPVAIRQRLADARAFLAAHPDLQAWAGQPVEARLRQLRRRRRAWPLITFAILTGRLEPDMDLVAAKHLGRRFGQTAEALYPADFAAARAAAERLGWSPRWSTDVVAVALPLAIAFCGRAMPALAETDLESLAAAIDATPCFTASVRRLQQTRLHGLRQLLYEARILDRPPPARTGDGPAPLAARVADVAAPEIRRSMLSYLEARQAVLRPTTVRKLANDLACFGEFIGERYPRVASLRDLERGHIEAFCAWLPTRSWRGRRGRAAPSQRVGVSSAAATMITLRNFLDDIAAWGWAERPSRRLVFSSDIPRPPKPLPRSLAPDVDAALMAAVGRLADPFARVGLTVLRGAGLRIGELLDLEVNCVVDYGAGGSWLRVPLGKLGTERSVPLDSATLAALDEWAARRGTQRALPHPRDGRMADFLFVEHGQRLTAVRLRKGLALAITDAGLRGPDQAPLRVVPHQLRHTYATTLANAGMSIQALMALLGHRTPEMTLRYATLASPTLRAAYEVAMGKMRPRLPLVSVGRVALPDRLTWLRSEMLKTRVAHGYCARELVAEACPYANICESCSNFVTAPEFIPALKAQLADVRALRDDAESRDWDSEVTRHTRVIASLEGHLRRVEKGGDSTTLG